MKLRNAPYRPQERDKITVDNFLHIIVSKVLTAEESNPIFADDTSLRFEVEGFRQATDGGCKPYSDEMSTKEVERLLTKKGGRVYREDENEEMTVVLSAR
jgi:hypothetical protein